MKRLTILLLIFTVAGLLSACGQSNNSDKNIALNQAPADVANLYKANCISCHAIDLSGKMGEATNLQQVYTRLSKEEIANKITNGGKTMPAFNERLTDEEIQGLAAWLSQQQ